MDDSYPTGYFQRGTTADGSGNGNDGVLSSTISVGEVTGFDGTGKAANFYASDTNAAIDCGTDPSIKPTGTGYTFATWVKFDDLDSYWQLIGGDWNDNGTAGEKYFYHFAVEQNNLISLFVAEPETDNLTRYAFFGGDTPITTDTWMHIGFTITPSDGTTPGEVILYRDGTRAAPIADYNFTSLPYTSEPVVLGAKTNAGSLPLHGQLDQTAIWTSALTETDFASLASPLWPTPPTSISPTTLGGFWDYETAVPLAPLTATVVDGSTNGNDGLYNVNGGEPFDPTGGQFDGAIAMRAGDGLTVNLGDLDTPEEMTFSAWINLDDPNSFNIIASQGDDNNKAEWAWQLLTNGGNVGFYVYDPAWDGTGDSWFLGGQASGLTEGWNHVAVTMSSNEGEETGEIVTYLNGVQSGTPTPYDMDSLLDSSVDIFLGTKANGPMTQYFRGEMDDVLLMDEALSATDIAYLFEHSIEEFLSDDLPGDANHDDQVDASDATILAGNWQAGPGATWEMGDFNGDGHVDASDATILAGNWQAGTGATTVPEPSSLVLLGALTGLFFLRRKLS
ncbi:MAG: dockerin type I domain-containing protein [Planctomycetia bacterium]